MAQTTQHPAMKANVQKWLCTDGKTWRAGCRATDCWRNCKDESDADSVVSEMAGMTAPQIKAKYS